MHAESATNRAPRSRRLEMSFSLEAAHHVQCRWSLAHLAHTLLTRTPMHRWLLCSDTSRQRRWRKWPSRRVQVAKVQFNILWHHHCRIQSLIEPVLACACAACSLTAAFEAMLDEATRDGFITPADDIRQSSQRQHPVQLHQQQQPPRQQQQHRQRGYDVDTGMQVERASGAGGGAGAGVGPVGGGAPTGASSGAATGAKSEVAAEFAELVPHAAGNLFHSLCLSHTTC